MILTVKKDIEVKTLQAFLGDICEWFYDREIEFGGRQFTVFEEVRAAYPQIFTKNSPNGSNILSAISSPI